MLSPRIRHAAVRVIPFGVIWGVSNLVFALVEYAALDSGGDAELTAIDMDLEILVAGTVFATAVGLMFGVIEVVFMGRVVARKSFVQAILFKAVFYSTLLAAALVASFPIGVAIEVGTHPLDPQVLQRLGDFLTSLNFVSLEVQFTSSLVVSLFYAEMSDKIGHGVLLNLFTGKYHRPTEEERIFLFSDMKSSTAIAEQLGHVRYFELLREYFADMAQAILTHSGEVYQYVGDEIVVSWELRPGTDLSACLRCFFAMKRDLAGRAEWYRERFGVAPTFKAGLHCGLVTTGEIGVLKKDIIFTGDVLNATARIQAMCNERGVDLLVSGDLAARLGSRHDFQLESLGMSELRGRDEAVELFTVSSAPGILDGQDPG